MLRRGHLFQAACFPALWAFFCASSTSAQSVIYVDADATGANNGSNWANAYTDLQAALTGSVSGDQIWVAAGTYKPAGPNGPRTASFQLRDGVGLYGGFAGNEANLSERNIANNPTILSGDLNGNDGPDFANYAENSYHVVVAIGSVSTGILDGFLIRSGNANGPSPSDDRGAGILCTGSPTLSNCTVERNFAFYSGGGLYGAWSNQPGFPAGTVKSCVFRENSAGAGGGLAIVSGDAFRMSRCLLVANRAMQGGGAMHTQYSSLRIDQCAFIRNSSEDGGAIFAQFGSPWFNNSLFNGNRAANWGGAMYLLLSASVVTNCTFASNFANSRASVYASNDSGSTFTNCIFASNVPGIDICCGVVVSYSCVGAMAVSGVGNIYVSPRFVDPFGPDQIMGTIDDDLRLARGSPCVDAGRNAALPADFADLDEDGDYQEPTPIDLKGDPRRWDDPTAPDNGEGTGPLVDMGAFELFLDCNTNGIVDGIDIANGTSQDCTNNGTPDECEADCNQNSIADSCDIAVGTSEDCDLNTEPDECGAAQLDCNSNGRPDGCDILMGTSFDCDSNEIPDECGIVFVDCNSNGLTDLCDVSGGTSRDCQVNGFPDECDIAAGTSVDANADGIPDECDCAMQVDSPKPLNGTFNVPVRVVLSANGAVQMSAHLIRIGAAEALQEFHCGFRSRDEWLAEFRESVARGETLDPALTARPTVQTVPAGGAPRIGGLGPDDLFLFEDTNHVGWSITLMRDAANQVIAAHGDQFDFVSFCTNFTPAEQAGNAFYLPIYNDVEGLGDDLFDLRAYFGVAGNRIQGFIMMYNVANWDHGTSEGADFTRLVLGQEFEHRFGVFLLPPSTSVSFQGGFPCGRSAHWNWQLDGQGSGMEMREWTGLWPAILGGRCVSYAPDECYSTDTGGVFSIADLYLMGYVSAAEMDARMSQFRYMNESDCSEPYFGGMTQISSADIIAGNGPRIPSWEAAQHHFKTAWVMIYQPEAPPTQAQIDRALGIMTQQQNDWYYSTLGRGTLDNSLVPATCVTEYDFYVGTDNPPTNLACVDAPLPICRPGALQPETTYYWQVAATNAAGTVTGPVWSFTTESRDCDANAIFDPCDLDCGEPGGPCDVPGCGLGEDCNENGTPDACDVLALDCNGNGTPDECDMFYGPSGDCQLDAIPDDCEIAAGSSLDCNANGRPDDCDVLFDWSEDCTSNGVPDECESDCNLNLVADSCDIAFDRNWDCNGDGLPDGCNLDSGSSADCNTNGVPDECEAAYCALLWGGFESVPPFAAGSYVDGIDSNADGLAWQNPSLSATITNQGCPASSGKALKVVSQTPPTADYLVSEPIAAPTGPISSLSFDVRSEAQLNPRIDWQLSIRDYTNDQTVILIHWASTQSNYPGVAAVNGRGRVLVQNPSGDPTFFNTGYALAANTCYNLRVSFNAFTGEVELFINDVLRVSTGRLHPGANRMSSFRLEQKANGQSSGGLNRLGLDNFIYCAAGAVATPGGMPDCNFNGILDECDIAGGLAPDCNGDQRPDSCERREDFDGDGQVTGSDFPFFAGCLTAPCDASCDLPLYSDPCCARADFESDGDVDLVDFSRLQSVLPSSAQDFDMDGDVDLSDWAEFADCVAGPGVAVDPACIAADADGDLDADLADLAAFQLAFTG